MADDLAQFWAWVQTSPLGQGMVGGFVLLVLLVVVKFVARVVKFVVQLLILLLVLALIVFGFTVWRDRDTWEERANEATQKIRERASNAWNFEDLTFRKLKGEN